MVESQCCIKKKYVIHSTKVHNFSRFTSCRWKGECSLGGRLHKLFQLLCEVQCCQPNGLWKETLTTCIPIVDKRSYAVNVILIPRPSSTLAWEWGEVTYDWWIAKTGASSPSNLHWWRTPPSWTQVLHSRLTPAAALLCKERELFQLFQWSVIYL